MTTRILFVCLGNICRSPSAEGVVRACIAERGLDIQTDSAGTGGWHVGDPPYGAMQKTAAKRGYDLSDLRARQVSVSDFDSFDQIIAMDADNLHNLRALRSTGSQAQLSLLTDFAPQLGADHVPDPYYTRDFDGALDLIEHCIDGLLAQL